jgi:glycosyltransferase involved in cell wall biosynthesis
MQTSSDSRPVLLAVGDAVVATGFARVLGSILQHLVHEFKIEQLGVNYRGDPHDKDWKIYPAQLGGEPQGVNRLKPLVKSIQPQIVFMVNDLWVLADYVDQLREFGPDIKIVTYCPIDAGPVDTDVLEHLEGIDQFVVYTKFAKTEVEKALALIREKKPDFSFPSIEIIPHGVDSVTFYCYSPDSIGQLNSPGRIEAIESLYGDDISSNSFIVLNANRNQPRKRIDITIQGFALFARNKPANVKLHLHMGVEDAGWNVIKLAKRYGIEERLILTTNGNNLPSLPDHQLNNIYNAAVVGLNTSAGEGWGLVSFEHAATGAAQIVPRHSACEELWEGAALMVDPVITLTTEQLLTDEKILAPGGVAAALETLYENPETLREMSIAAYRRATTPEYQWSTIARRWSGLFHNTLAKT